MDPISHGIIGIAVASFSHEPVAMTSAITIGSMLGAMSPDLDFVIRIFKDDVEYLEHHRGFSHSLPMLALFSIGITAMLSMMPFDNFQFWTILMWTFLGALSHTVFDILNSYGARLFQRKRKGNILTLYDPIVTLVCFGLIFNRQNGLGIFALAAAVIGPYLILRWYMRERARKNIMKALEAVDTIEDVNVMPSLKIFYKWDFVARGDQYNIVGQYNPFRRDPIHIIKKFEIKDKNLLAIVQKTAIGKKFSQMSPSLHIEVIDEEPTYVTVRIIDLRYFFRNAFLHQGTLILDSAYNPVESVFHPYKLSKAVLVAS
jgi:inner membrane protein